MTRITAILNQKGGTGKTTTAHALTAGLTFTKRNVLAVDADQQCNLTYIMQGDLNAPGTFEAIQGKTPNIQALPNGDLLGANDKLLQADTAFKDYSHSALSAALDPIKGRYDHIIIDCPPNMGFMTQSALMLCTDIIIPVLPGELSVMGLGQMLKTYYTVKQVNPDLTIAGILYTQVNRRSSTHRQYMEQISEYANVHSINVYGTVIYSTISVQDAQSVHTSIYEYNHKGTAALTYRDLLKEYLLQEKRK